LWIFFFTRVRDSVKLCVCSSCFIQEAANALHLLPSRKRTMPVLHDVSGIIKPRRWQNLLACLLFIRLF
jgi:hypothetical protein